MPDEKKQERAQAEDQNRIQRIFHPLDPLPDKIEDAEGGAAGDGQVEVPEMPFQGRRDVRGAVGQIDAVSQQGDARGADHHLPEDREGGFPGPLTFRLNRSREMWVSLLNPEGHPDENQPDEGPAGHLFRPTEGCIEGIAKKNLGQRDRDCCQEKKDADGLQGAVKPAKPLFRTKREERAGGRDGIIFFHG